ncbi:hypothetical protein [Actinokineospora sp.]|uniref:hypothetical protein n=1 Tax=Actinokineospora sp. TaxID=1872133 RepID=UPI004037F858
MESDVDDGVRWGVSSIYRGRAHLLYDHDRAGLCGLPTTEVFCQRPAALICPECAIAYVAAVFPSTPPVHPGRPVAGRAVPPAFHDRDQTGTW